FQRSASGPNVTSNLPPVHSLTWRAARSASRTSGLTATARVPAASLIRSTSLPARQTLINASSRSNSRNAASNAACAAASSAVHAVSRRSDPIAGAAPSTRWGEPTRPPHADAIAAMTTIRRDHDVMNAPWHAPDTCSRAFGCPSSPAESDAPPWTGRRAHQFPDRLEHDAELRVVLALHLADLPHQGRSRPQHAPHPDERAHDLDIDANGPLAAQHARQHRDSLLGEGVRNRATTTVRGS